MEIHRTDVININLNNKKNTHKWKELSFKKINVEINIK